MSAEGPHEPFEGVKTQKEKGGRDQESFPVGLSLRAREIKGHEKLLN